MEKFRKGVSKDDTPMLSSDISWWDPSKMLTCPVKCNWRQFKIYEIPLIYNGWCCSKPLFHCFKMLTVSVFLQKQQVFSKKVVFYQNFAFFLCLSQDTIGISKNQKKCFCVLSVLEGRFSVNFLAKNTSQSKHFIREIKKFIFLRF